MQPDHWGWSLAFIFLKVYGVISSELVYTGVFLIPTQELKYQQLLSIPESHKMQRVVCEWYVEAQTRLYSVLFH